MGGQFEEGEVERWVPPSVTAEFAGETEAELPTAEAIEQIHAEARAEGQAQGYQEGYAKGLSEGRAQAAVEHEALIGMLDQLADPMRALDDEITQTLAGLVTTVARQLVRRELKTAPDEIVGVIREALKALPPGSEQMPTVRVNPEDAELIREVLSNADDAKPWRLESDPLIGRGGCIVETAQSYLDASLENRINQIALGMFGGTRSADDGRSGDARSGNANSGNPSPAGSSI